MTGVFVTTHRELLSTEIQLDLTKVSADTIETIKHGATVLSHLAKQYQ